MSVQNLSLGQINLFECPCNVTGAITGTSTITFRRLNGLVNISFPILATAVGVSGPTITYTPTVTVPDQYKPTAGVFRFISVSNNGTTALGTLLFPNSFSSFTVQLQAGGNFTGTSGVVDNTILYQSLN